MRLITCPHCSHRHVVASQVPKDVVVVLPCPNCSDLCVLFRDKVVGLKRQVLEEGTFDERKEHLAEVIAHFLEPDMVWPEGLAGADAFGQSAEDEPEWAAQEDAGAPQAKQPQDEQEAPITQGEVDNFVRLNLQKIDDPVYFRQIFG